MLRVFGYLLKQNKSIYIALTKIFGLGVNLALKYLKLFNIKPTIKIYRIDLDTLQKLYSYIESQKFFENNLRKLINNNIDRLKYIKSYRGLRHLNSLPLRGQRTRTNAKTMKRKRSFKNLKKTKIIWKKKK